MATRSPASGKASPAASQRSGNKSRELVSRQSGKVTFPNSARSGASTRKSNMSGREEDESRVNPFKMPADNDIFMLRDKERQRAKQERLKQRELKVHEKTTYATRINFKTASMIHPEDSDGDGDRSDEDDGRAVAVKNDPQFTLAVTRDRHVEKESLTDYIAKKRDMFLVQFSLGVKRDEMRKLEEIAAAEEKKLELAEQYLEEDAAMFDEFLKENDKNSVEAIKIAEAETKAKLEKVAEIKKINAQMMAIRSEISKYEDTLKEYQLYKKFLETLTQKEWLEERREERAKRREERRRHREHSELVKRRETPTGSELSMDLKGSKKKGRGNRSVASLRDKGTPQPGEVDSVASLTDSDEESEEEPELYFNDPQQLLDIFAELEEQNLSLIQNSQETEEALEEMKQTIKQTKQKMENETRILKEQIDKLNNNIGREEEKAKDLEMKARMFSYGEFKAEDQEKMLEALNHKVEAVYSGCIGGNEANISTLQMLTNLENRVEELFQEIERLPPDIVEAAEKDKEKDRRLRMREEKAEEQKRLQEERIERSLKRAREPIKKQTGRRAIGRSQPPRMKKANEGDDEDIRREEEEHAYFFMP